MKRINDLSSTLYSNLLSAWPLAALQGQGGLMPYARMTADQPRPSCDTSSPVRYCTDTDTDDGLTILSILLVVRYHYSVLVQYRSKTNFPQSLKQTIQYPYSTQS